MTNTRNPREAALEAKCADCGRPYSDGGFQDFVVPNDVWAKISPTGDENGLLCPSCMCKRAADAGLEDVPAVFRSGPFAAPPPAADGGWRPIEDAPCVYGSGTDVQLTDGHHQWVGCRGYALGMAFWVIDGGKTVKPTHYKPLDPPPPVPQSAEDEGRSE